MEVIINWGTINPIPFQGAECSYNYYLRMNGSISYKVTDQKLFDQGRGEKSAQEYVNSTANYLLNDYVRNNKIKESEVAQSSQNLGQNISKYMRENSSKYTNKGFEIIVVNVKGMDLPEDSMRTYEYCLKSLTESNSNMVNESNSNTEQTIPVKVPEPIKEKNNMLPLYIGLVVAVIVIVGILFIFKKKR